MIYKKDVNFPYPLLTNTSTSYDSSDFIFEVELQENARSYHFIINYEISSDFITRLLVRGQAQLVLVIQSKDNKFYKLLPTQKSVEIAKSRISLSKRTTLQLHLLSKEEISFAENGDLNEFYNLFRDEIVVPKNSILGFSNIVVFEGSLAKPLDLFEKKLDPELRSDIKIELGSETIIIHYKHENLQFNDLPMSNRLNNPFIYMGLQKALHRFIVIHGEGEEFVDLQEIDVPSDELDLKLYNLMKKKAIQELSIDTIDEVIYAISDRIMERYMNAVRGLSVSGS
ncbi:hypothetical protein [Niallia sp. FSL R7-0271]|uniref:hypothetical protein n=1 Tax=Niallia sp. FSL R7-0271 TaxID=2921678 RepID=UPI0030FD100F